MKQNKLFFLVFIVIFSIFVYYMMDYWTSFYFTREKLGTEYGNFISTDSMGKAVSLLVAFCLFSFLSFNHKNRGVIFIVCYLWIIQMLLVTIYNRSSIFHYATTILWPTLFLTSYNISISDSKTFKYVRSYFFIVFFLGLFYFLRFRLYYSSDQTNTVYLAAFLAPWLLCVKDSRKQIFLLVLFSILALLSMKRSIILAFLLAWPFFFVFRIKKEKSILSILTLVIICFILIYLFSFVDNWMGGMLSDRMAREETDEGRNRLAIYEITFAMITNSDIISLIFGHGHFGVIRDSPLQISAHNDLLECVYDYGLIIFALYLLLWFYVIRRCVSFYKKRSSFFVPYAVSVTLFVSQSLFEHLLLYGSWFCYLVMFWGCMEAFIEKEENMNVKYAITFKNRVSREYE